MNVSVYVCKLCSVWFTSQTATLIHSENFCQSFNIATTRRSHIQQQMREPNMHQAMCVNTQKYQCIHGYQHRRHSKLTLHPNTVSTGKKKQPVKGCVPIKRNQIPDWFVSQRQKWELQTKRHSPWQIDESAVIITTRIKEIKALKTAENGFKQT